MTTTIPADVAIASAHGAVTRIVALVNSGIDESAPTPCSKWSVSDVVRHLEAIAGAYVLWVSAAIGGRVGDLKVGDELAAYNQSLLERMPNNGLARHVTTFSQLAVDHLRLVEAFPDPPMLRAPGGEVWSVQDHVGVAAIEWHVHAWDLSRAAGTVHVPDARPLAQAWRATLGQTVGPQLDGWTTDNGATWEALLRATGRTP